MGRLLLTILSLVFIPPCYAADNAHTEDAEEGIRMLIHEGQFISEPFEIFVNQDIRNFMDPKLTLINISLFHGESEKKSEDIRLNPRVIARKQTRMIDNIALKGTVLLFNIRQYPFRSYEILKQVRPVLVWENPADPTQPYQAIGNPTNLGNDIPFIIFILIIVGCCITVFATWSKCVAEKSVFGLLTGNDGYLSLSRTQVAAWTVVVGGFVLGFGLLMLNVPNIPNSLLALMGLSLATGGIKHYAASEYNTPNIMIRKRRLADLICENDADTDITRTSLPKAQMLFWTVLMLYLFVVKSFADGELWKVPWEMVALMGMSQAAYLSPHLPGVREKESGGDSATITVSPGEKE